MFQSGGLVATAIGADPRYGMVRRLITLTTLTAALAVPAAAQAAGTTELIVRRDPGLTAAERADLRADAGVDYQRRLRLADTEVVTVPAADASNALAELEVDPDVRWAMRNGEVGATAVITDPMWSQLWGLPTMHVPEAWATATGAGVTVAVTDTGVEESHPDLLGQLRPDGWDFVNSDNDPADDDGHGTHVTGTIAALNGNAVGLSGTAPDAKVLPLKVLDGTGHGNWADLADAWDLAGDMGVKIVNASLGGTGSIPVVNDVVAAHPNTLFVVAAGNDDVDLDLATYTPCEVPSNNVLCVGASDQYDLRAYFSNYGSTGVDVYAPGVDILSTWPGAGYAYLDGTSMATPNVAAVAALLLSNIPDLSPTELKAAIMNTADDKPGLESVSGGRVNANAALAAVGTDRDGDGVENADDNCPTRRGPASNHGCPLDSDHDGVYDDLDACPSLSGPAYLAGCPVPPKPPVRDRDADGVPDDRDACPDTRAPGSPFGCPPERLRVGSVKAGGRAARVTVKFSASRGASIKVTAERRVCRRKKKCTWRTAKTARASGSHGTVRLRLRAGRYRIKVTATDRGERASRTKTITVRR
jgi:thermitase